MSRTLKQTRERQNTPAPEREKSFDEKVREKAGELLVQAAANELVISESFDEKVREKSSELLAQAAANERAVAARIEQQRRREEQTRRAQYEASLPHGKSAEDRIREEQLARAKSAVEAAHRVPNGVEYAREIDEKRRATLELAQRVARDLSDRGVPPTHTFAISEHVAVTKKKLLKDPVITGTRQQVTNQAKGWRINTGQSSTPGSHIILLEDGSLMSLRGHIQGKDEKREVIVGYKANTISVPRDRDPFTPPPKVRKNPTTRPRDSYSLITEEFESDITRPPYTPAVPDMTKDEGLSEEDWKDLEDRGIVVSQHELGTQQGLMNLYANHFPDTTSLTAPATSGRHRAPE
ncbi:MAG: hypothetical protein JWP13_11 [Candidatus Saccharibacteria bacterium]|nr:hypothetical protein [Candidatus Saccharibacteria bacterium]